MRHTIVINNIYIVWYRNWNRHRICGPAVESAEGERQWWMYDRWHREEGPALECNDGYKLWCIDGKLYTEEEFNRVKK